MHDKIKCTMHTARARRINIVFFIQISFTCLFAMEEEVRDEKSIRTKSLDETKDDTLEAGVDVNDYPTIGQWVCIEQEHPKEGSNTDTQNGLHYNNDIRNSSENEGDKNNEKIDTFSQILDGSSDPSKIEDENQVSLVLDDEVSTDTHGSVVCKDTEIGEQQTIDSLGSREEGELNLPDGSNVSQMEHSTCDEEIKDPEEDVRPRYRCAVQV